MVPDGVRYYVTALSNLVRGYDKFARVYDKTGIPESSYPDRFFLLPREQLAIGIAKAQHLPGKTGLDGDCLIAIQTRAPISDLKPNLRNGLGQVLESGQIPVEAVHLVDAAGQLVDIGLEEACARSYRTLTRGNPGFEQLLPRSVSVLPIARACPARCSFCFSRASVSADTRPQPPDWSRVTEVLRGAAGRGARRAVITGGGEPSLLPAEHLQRLIREAATYLPRVVLISNGYRWGRLEPPGRRLALDGLAAAGLSILALSRHHHRSDRAEALMGLDTGSDVLAQTWASSRERWPRLKLRWICVLQRGGVEDRPSLEDYLDWAVGTGVPEICFKELYVSTSVESEYHDAEANRWSASHQVPLKLVLDLAADAGWVVRERLPWGAPVYEGDWRGRAVRVVAYTEPSLLWELSNGICRSWNLMADGRCLASLEDRNSEVLGRGLRRLQTVA
jgi:molybdenum cofactor biosynthesis enzyme MoaA